MATFLSAPWTAPAPPPPANAASPSASAPLLEDDYLCWYDVPGGPRYQHPD